MSKKYKSHPADLKFKVALEAAKNEKTVNQIASEHAVAPSCVTDWKKTLLAEASSIFQNKKAKKTTEIHEDVEHLQKQIGKLTVQIEWLKKKLGITS